MSRYSSHANRLQGVLMVFALLAISFVAGGIVAFVTGKIVSHTEPGGTCTVLDPQSSEAAEFCKIVRSPRQVYGWPFDVRSKSLAPGLPEDAYKLQDRDFSIPIIGLLMDGIFANWFVYSVSILLILGVVVVVWYVKRNL